MKLKTLFESNYENNIILKHDDCVGNKLPTDLPATIIGDFMCISANLTSLKGCPSEIGGRFTCQGNKLTSLKGIEYQIKSIGGDFECAFNEITSHILGLMLIQIDGDIITELGSGTDVDEILNKWKNQGRKGVFGASKDLLDLGYKELAQI